MFWGKNKVPSYFVCWAQKPNQVGKIDLWSRGMIDKTQYIEFYLLLQIENEEKKPAIFIVWLPGTVQPQLICAQAQI